MSIKTAMTAKARDKNTFTYPYVKPSMKKDAKNTIAKIANFLGVFATYFPRKSRPPPPILLI